MKLSFFCILFFAIIALVAAGKGGDKDDRPGRNDMGPPGKPGKNEMGHPGKPGKGKGKGEPKLKCKPVA
jgi:hypothetical protein